MCLIVALAGCGDSSDSGSNADSGSGGSGSNSNSDGNLAKEIAAFLEDGIGQWYRCGDRNSDVLTIFEGGTWALTSADGEITGKGTLAMSEFDEGVVQYENEMSNQIFPAIPVEDGSLLNYGGTTYVRSDYTAYGLDQFDGSYYLDGDRDADYYTFENGEWKFYEAQGAGHFSTQSGLLIFNGGDLIVDGYRVSGEEPPFDVLTNSADDTLISGDKSYVKLEDAESTYDSDAYDYNGNGYLDDDEMEDYLAGVVNGGENSGGSASTENEIIVGIFYYRMGNSDLDSLYFYDDGTVDLDSPGYDTVEATYSVDGDQLTIVYEGESQALTISYDGDVQALTDEWDNQYLSKSE
jgi:hypothetical protein